MSWTELVIILRLTPRLRKELKKPLGILLQGTLEEIIEKLREIIKISKSMRIVTVGDRVSQDLYDHNILPDVLIVDNRIMRNEVPPVSVNVDQVMSVKNPRGTITEEAWRTIEGATRDSIRTKIIVDGEEDLLTLVAVLTIPEDSLVIYGQPKKGMVVVKATLDMKREVSKIIQAMKG